jgi:hypothetical protein
MVAKRAAAAGETIHNEPITVTPALVLEAMQAADSAGTSFRQSMEKHAPDCLFFGRRLDEGIAAADGARGLSAPLPHMS